MQHLSQLYQELLFPQEPCFLRLSLAEFLKLKELKGDKTILSCALRGSNERRNAPAKISKLGSEKVLLCFVSDEAEMRSNDGDRANMRRLKINFKEKEFSEENELFFCR